MNRVEQLRAIHAEMEELKDRERRLSEPIVENMGMIRNLYDVFRLSLKRQDPKAEPDSTADRKKFLYAILYIFSPATLVGEVMRHRLRECVSAVIGCTPTGVSRDYKTGLFFYSTYTDFRESVNKVIRDMLEYLNKPYDEYKRGGLVILLFFVMVFVSSLEKLSYLSKLVLCQAFCTVLDITHLPVGLRIELLEHLTLVLLFCNVINLTIFLFDSPSFLTIPEHLCCMLGVKGNPLFLFLVLNPHSFYLF